MKRSGRIQRHTPLPRASKPMRARNPKRYAKNFARAYESEAFVLFVQSLPCIVPGCPRTAECAHLVKIDGGAGLKGRSQGCGPCCGLHHRTSKHSLHDLGPRSFEALHHLSLAECARQTEAAWQREQERVA